MSERKRREIKKEASFVSLNSRSRGGQRSGCQMGKGMWLFLDCSGGVGERASK